MPLESKTADPSCRRQRMALGLPYAKSNCTKCGHLMREGWRCANEAAADSMRDAAFKATLLVGFRAEVARCEELLDEARGRLTEAEDLLANRFPVIGDAP